MAEDDQRNERKPEIRMVPSRERCPIFDGTEDEYGDWKERVEDWLIISDHSPYPGIEIRASLKGKAYDIVKDLNREELKNKGAPWILEELDKVFKKDNRILRMEKARTFYTIQRRKEETIKDYIIRYEDSMRKCEKAGGGTMSEELKASHLLGQANLTKTDLHVVLGACGTEEFNFEKLKGEMTRIFQDEERKEDLRNENIWMQNKETLRKGKQTKKNN